MKKQLPKLYLVNRIVWWQKLKCYCKMLYDGFMDTQLAREMIYA